MASHLLPIIDFLSAPTTFTPLIACLTVLFFVSWWSRKHLSVEAKRSPPQPGGSRPFLGHLHLLGGPEVIHKAMAKLADENGPLFMLKLGVHRGIVVSNGKMAKECLSTNDKAFADRPKTLGLKFLGYNYAMFSVSPYGPYWRKLRKISTVELLSNYRLSQLMRARVSEVRASIRELYDRCAESSEVACSGPKALVDMSQWFADLTLNSILRLIAGKSLREFHDADERDRCWKAFRGWLDLIGVTTVSDALPFLKWIDIAGYQKVMKKAAEDLDSITQGWLDYHKRDRLSGMKEKRDFMDVLLEIFGKDDKKFYGYDGNTVIKATCLMIVVAGADTTSGTLIWALSLLMNHPHALKRAKEELDTHVGRERTVDNSDLKHLSYLQAIMKETMRLYPAAPLILRETNTDAVVGGYHIPAGTRVFVNVHKIHRDPLMWSNPDEFRPERFLTTHEGVRDIRGQDFEFLPFGGGKRVCPGASYALQAVPFVLANLLHSFDITPPSKEPIDMTEGHGLTTVKATPLEVFLTPSLPHNFYETGHEIGD